MRLFPKTLSIALGLCLAASTSQAATFFVTTTADGGPGSLRQAVIDANNSPGADTIQLGHGVFNLSLTGPGEDFAATGDLNVREDLEILGNGAQVSVINGLDSDTVFDVHAGRLTLTRLTVTRGNAPGVFEGGGVFLRSNTTGVFTECAFVENMATFGGGVRLEFATAIFSHCELFANVGNGSAVESQQGLVQMTNCTISGNSGQGGSGALRLSNARKIELESCTVVDNSAGGIAIGGGSASGVLHNTIVANNPSGDILDPAVTSLGYNLIKDVGPAAAAFTAAGDITGLDPVLGPLQFNGGATRTHQLLAGSPAYEAGDPAIYPIDDQRGFARPMGSAADIGAYEADPAVKTEESSWGSVKSGF